jgi:peptidase C13-like protein
MARRSLAAFHALALAWVVAASLVPTSPGRAQEAAPDSARREAAQGAREPDNSQDQAQPGKADLNLDVEAVSRRQPLLLERAFATLEGAREDRRPRLFFVGFAGYGWEAVFKREALAVRGLFDNRFGTGGRSMVLVNHRSTADDIALASPANLDRALQHIGGLMNADADTLFLFLTSHGRKNRFAVEMPGFAFDDLTPAGLKAMLDRARIKNRVVVISACHSGSFIPTLASPTTLVIAAAHADRTSFGCEDRREWTYFGDAFFNRALRQERSFERAFQLARRTIGRWEARERLTRSLPQIAGGEALKPRLDELARAK